jgi:hypothetical protein
MEEATATKRAGIEKAIEAKKVEINALQRKLNEKFWELMGICDKLFRLLPRREQTVEELAKDEQLGKDHAANEKETKELEKLKAAKVTELKELCEQIGVPLPKY